MTQFGINHSTDRILPLPYLPTYIARRPPTSKSSSENITELYNPIFTTNWQKASDNYAAQHRNFYGSPFINIDLDSAETSPKQYDSYKPSYFAHNDLDSLNRARPLMVPNHITQTSQKWSRFLDEYPDRFKIQYPLPNDDNDLYVQKRPGRYPYQINKESPSFYTGLTSQIQPVTNPFRQMESKQKSTVAHPIWVPYGISTRRFHKP